MWNEDLRPFGLCCIDCLLQNFRSSLLSRTARPGSRAIPVGEMGFQRIPVLAQLLARDYGYLGMCVLT